MKNPEALQAFVGPGIPASRLTGDQDGLYVSHGPIISKAFGWTNIGTTNNFVKREIIVCDVCLYRPYRCIYLLIFVDFDYVLMVYFLFQ